MFLDVVSWVEHIHIIVQYLSIYKMLRDGDWYMVSKFLNIIVLVRGTSDKRYEPMTQYVYFICKRYKVR